MILKLWTNETISSILTSFQYAIEFVNAKNEVVTRYNIIGKSEI